MGTLTYHGKVLKGLLVRDFFAHKNTLPDILRPLGWQDTDGIWKRHSGIDPVYAAMVDMNSGRVSIVNEKNHTADVPPEIREECNKYFTNILYEMFKPEEAI